MKSALFPGTFSPPTLGHLDIIQRASKLYDKLYVAITDENSAKNPSLFTLEDRKALLKTMTASLKNVEITTFDGLVVDYAKTIGANVLVRGLRNGADLDYEYQMAWTNHAMTSVETVFLLSTPQYAHINATLIREIAAHGKRLHGFVPDAIEEAVFKRYKQKRNLE